MTKFISAIDEFKREEAMLDIIITLLGFSGILVIALKIFERRMYNMVDSIGEIFSQILEKPSVSKAMGILGKASGDARSQRAIIDDLAQDILAGPKFNALKMGASMIGINIDEYIQEHGALATLESLQTIGKTLGIDVNDIMAGGITEIPSMETGRNPYL